MPAQVLLALLQIHVPQGARERTKHLSHDVHSRASGLPCNAVLHTAVACPQRPVGVGARNAYPMPIHRASIRSCLLGLPADQKQVDISKDTTSLRPLGLVAVSVLPCATSKS
jgi:hypothetical protein